MYMVWGVWGCMSVCAGVCIMCICGLYMYTCGVCACLMNSLFRFLPFLECEAGGAETRGRDYGLRVHAWPWERAEVSPPALPCGLEQTTRPSVSVSHLSNRMDGITKDVIKPSSAWPA